MKYNTSILLLASRDLFEIHEYLSDFGENPPIKFKNSRVDEDRREVKIYRILHGKRNIGDFV